MWQQKRYEGKLTKEKKVVNFKREPLLNNPLNSIFAFPRGAIEIDFRVRQPRLGP
jgi:hypothetical protein